MSVHENTSCGIGSTFQRFMFLRHNAQIVSESPIEFYLPIDSAQKNVKL